MLDRRTRSIVAGAAGGALMGLLSAFCSPAAIRGMIALEVQVAAIVGLAVLGGFFGRWYDDAR